MQLLKLLCMMPDRSMLAALAAVAAADHDLSDNAGFGQQSRCSPHTLRTMYAALLGMTGTQVHVLSCRCFCCQPRPAEQGSISWEPAGSSSLTRPGTLP